MKYLMIGIATPEEMREYSIGAAKGDIRVKGMPKLWYNSVEALVKANPELHLKPHLQELTLTKSLTIECVEKGLRVKSLGCEWTCGGELGTVVGLWEVDSSYVEVDFDSGANLVVLLETLEVLV